MEIHGVQVPLAREDPWADPRCELAKFMEGQVRSMVARRLAPDLAVSTLEVQSGEGQAILLLYSDAYLHGAIGWVWLLEAYHGVQGQ